MADSLQITYTDHRHCASLHSVLLDGKSTTEERKEDNRRDCKPLMLEIFFELMLTFLGWIPVYLLMTCFPWVGLYQQVSAK